jgi:heme-degrading monooxygenase HmoA
LAAFATEEEQMHARVSLYDLNDASRDDAVAAFEQARSAVEQMQGNQGGMLLVGTNGDKAITVTFWESEQALRASAEQADEARQQAAGSAGMTITGVEPYEVALEFGAPMGA